MLIGPGHAEVIDLREVVLDLGERIQHHAAVARTGLVGGGPRRAHAGLAPAAVEDRLEQARPDRPELVRRRQQPRIVSALEAALCAQRQRRKIGGARDADACVGRRHATLGGGDVRPPLQQGCRHAERNLRQRQLGGLHGQRELIGRIPDQHGDRILHECPLRQRLRPQRAGRGQLRLRTRHVQARHEAAAVQRARQLQRLAECIDALLQQRHLLVDATQLDVVVGQLCLQAQLRRGEIRRRGQGVVPARLDRVAHAAPQVQFVIEAGAGAEVVVVGRRSIRPGQCPTQRPGVRLMVTLAAGIGADGGEQRRARLLVERLRLAVVRQRRGEIGIAGEQALLQLVEPRIVVELPPAIARQTVGRLRRLPQSGVPIGRRQRHRRHFVGGRQRAAGQRDHGGQQRGEFRLSHGSRPWRWMQRSAPDRLRQDHRAGCR